MNSGRAQNSRASRSWARPMSRRWNARSSGGRSCGADVDDRNLGLERLCYIAAHAYDSRVFFWLLLVLQPLRRPRALSVPEPHANELPQTAGNPGGFFISEPARTQQEQQVNATTTTPSDSWYARPV